VIGDTLEDAFTFYLSLFTFHILTSAPPPFLLESIPQIRLLQRGSGGSTIDVIDCYRVQTIGSYLLMAQMVLSFCAGTGDVLDRGRQTTYDTGYIVLLFGT
jgi:hypothetical protein